MKKNKGFTLIEILAVVVILGLLVAIAYPAVNSYISSTKDSTYTLHESDMKTAAANMMSECIQNDTEDCVPKPGESRTIYLSELVDTKYSNPIKDPEKKDSYCKDGESYVIVTNTGSSTLKLDYDVCLTCDKYASGKCSELEPGGTCDSTTDTTKPVCGDIVGASTLWTNKDRVISVKCSDTGCGCTKGSFYKTFNETLKTGTITIVDKAGQSEECEVNVYVDKDMPTCELEIVGDIGENEWYGGEAPIVRFKKKDDATSGVATYGLGLSSKNPEFNKKDEFTAPAGISTVFGYVKDNAGNVTICRTSDIKYDNVPATIDTVDYGTVVYVKNDLSKVDSNKRKITLDKKILDEYGDIYGLYFYQKSSSTGMNVSILDGTSTMKTVTLSSGVTTPIRVLFSSPIRIKDNDLIIDLGANNKVDSISRIEIITRNDTVGYYTNQDVTLYINSHDSLSGKAYYTFDGTSFKRENYNTYSKNTTMAKVGLKDTAGNISDLSTIKITNIDKLLPIVTFNIDGTKGTDGWYKSDKVTVSISPSDAGSTAEYTISGVRYYDLSLSDSVSYNNVSELVQIDNTIGTSYYGYVIDNAGNENSNSITIKKDSVKPTISLVAKERTSGEVIASDKWASEGLNYVFTSTSGVSGFKVYYCKDTNNTCEPSILVGSAATLTLTELNTLIDQTYYVRYKVVSNAGISSSVYSYRAKVDTVVPTASIVATRKDNSNTVTSGKWVNTGLNFKVSSGTVGISGATLYYCKDTDNTCDPSTTISSGGSITSYNGLVNNVYYIRYKIVSNAGLSTVYSYTARTDTTDPTCSLTANNSNVVFNTKYDGASDIHSYDLLTSSSATYDNSTSKPLAVGTFYGHVKDNANNTGSCSLTLKKAQTYYTQTQHTCTKYNYVNCSKDATIKHYIKEHSSCYKYDVKYKCTQDATYSCSEGKETSDGMCKISYTNACQTEFGLASRNFACEECMARWGSCRCGCVLSVGWADVTIAKKASCPNGGTLSSGTCTLTNQTSIKVGWTCTQTSAKYTFDLSVQDYPGIAVCKNANPTCNKEADIGNEQVNCRPIYECKDGGTLSGQTCTKTNQYSCSSGWSSSTSTSTYLAWDGGVKSDVLSCAAVQEPICNNEGREYVASCSGPKYRCTSSLGNTKVGSGSAWYCF